MSLILGDMLEVLETFEENSISACVCDPPYDLTNLHGQRIPQYGNGKGAQMERANRGQPGGFMSMKWDGTGVAFKPETWAKVYRVLRPGAYLLAFGGTRTIHRMTCAIEDAGFIIRDQIAYLHAQGFPKSLDIGKQIDKRGGAEIGWFGPWLRVERERRGIPQKDLAAYFPSKTGNRTGCVANWELGFNLPTPEQFNKLCEVLDLPFDSIAAAEREVIGHKRAGIADSPFGSPDEARKRIDITAPATDAARQWDGFGTALKPAMELIVLAQKPLDGTYAQNVLKWGCGALNIDQSRIGTTDDLNGGRYSPNHRGLDGSTFGSGINKPSQQNYQQPTGRWPSNVMFSHVSPGPDGTGGCEEIGTRRVKSGSNYGPSSGYDATNTNLSATINSTRGQGYAAADGTETVTAFRCVEGCPIAELDRQSGERGLSRGVGAYASPGQVYGNGQGLVSQPKGKEVIGYGDTGGASRFFQTFPPEVPRFVFQSKPSRAERERGLAGMPEQDYAFYGGDMARLSDPRMDHKQNRTPRANTHPTVKSIALMRHLLTLVVPPGGTCLDPFMGSGSTGVAAAELGIDFVGIESDEGYFKIAQARCLDAELRRDAAQAIPLLREVAV